MGGGGGRPRRHSPHRSLDTPETKKFPAPSLSTPLAAFSCADVAAPPLPAEPAVAVPAALTIMPLLNTRRTRLFPESAMSSPPRPSSDKPARVRGDGVDARWRTTGQAPHYAPAGLFSVASTAGPPSPVVPNVPGIPAQATTVPFANRRRTAWFEESGADEWRAGGARVTTAARHCTSRH